MTDENQNPYRQAREVENDALSRMTGPSPKEVGWDEGFAAGRAAATPELPEGCRAPHCFSEYGTPCGTCPVLAASADKGWSPGIDDPEPPALGDIDTGEGWYQT